MEAFWEDEDFESKLKEGILAQKKFKILYRLFLVVSGILLFLVGWITWNIPLKSEDGTHNSLFVRMNEVVGYDLAWPLFLSGLFMQLFVAPWFVFSSISKTGRLSLLVPKEVREYLALKGEIKGKYARKEIEKLYWEALNDPNHRYHKEIIRYKWMDKIRWKHRPSDFFGHVKYTKETGEVTLGPVVPKTSDAYRNSNVTFDENNNVNGIANPAIHPLRRLFPPLFLFLLTGLSAVLESLLILQSGESNLRKEEVLKLFALPCFFAWFIVKRNTELLPGRKLKRKRQISNLSDDALHERMNLLREKYLSVQEHEERIEAYLSLIHI